MSGSPVRVPQLPALTGLRGLAAWLVVLYHIRLAAGAQVPPELVAVLAKGYLAVDFFFMLSGFVLWLNYAETLRAQGLAGVPRFLGRRIARIWPLHMFILACAIAFAAALAVAGKLNPDQYPWAELPLHIFLIHNWGFTSDISWNDPSWSISCEFAAYILFPFLLFAVDWRKVLPETALAAIVACSALLYYVMSRGGAEILDDDIPRFGLIRALAQFTIGTILCGLWMRWRANPKVYAARALAFAVPFALLGLSGVWPETRVVPFILAALLLAAALTAELPRNPLAWRPLYYLGQISYSTYLAHFLLFVLFKLLFVEDAYDVPLGLLGAFLVLTFIVSAALHHLVELPAQRALNRAIDQAARRRALSAA